MKNKADYIIYTDGGSRGNPGPAALGVVIVNSSGTMKKEYGQYIGETTNNDAEYQALIFALKKLKALAGKDKIGNAIVDVFLDSQLIERQMNGAYKINDETVAKHFIEIHNLKVDYKEVRFNHVSREKK